MDAAFKRLRADLQAEGIGRGDARELLSTLDWDSALTVEAGARDSFGQRAVSGPQTDRREGES